MPVPLLSRRCEVRRFAHIWSRSLSIGYLRREAASVGSSDTEYGISSIDTDSESESESCQSSPPISTHGGEGSREDFNDLVQRYTLEALASTGTMEGSLRFFLFYSQSAREAAALKQRYAIASCEIQLTH